MRVSSNLMVNRYQKQLNTSYENQAKIMERSDGSNLHRPSDDAVNYAKYLRFQNTNTENIQYQSNVDNGRSWMRTADAAMVNMTDIYTTLKEKTIDAANDTNGDLDMVAIAKEFKAKLFEISSLMNTQQGNRYLFAGQSDLTQPFIISVGEKERGLPKTLDDPQAAFFTNPNDNTLNVDGTGTLKQMLTLKTNTGELYYLNTMSGRIYTEDFIMNGYKDKVAAGQAHVADGDEVGVLRNFESSNFKVANYFKNTGELREEASVTITTTMSYNAGDTFTSADLETLGDVTVVADNDINVTDTNTGTVIRTIAAGETVNLADGETANITTDTTLTATSTTPLSYGTGDSLSLGAGQTAVADMPVGITDSDGNVIRVVPAGEPISLAAGESAVIGVPLSTYVDADTTLTGTSSNTESYATAGTIFQLDSNQTATATADIQILDESNNIVRTVSAGETISLADGEVGCRTVDANTSVTVTTAFTRVFSMDERFGSSDLPEGDLITSDNDVLVTGEDGTTRTIFAGQPIVLGEGETAVGLGRTLGFEFATIKQPLVSYQGDAKYISMVKLNGSVDQTSDTVNATGQDLNGSDIFDDVNSGNQTMIQSNGKTCYVSSGTAMINNMFTVCVKMEGADARWMSTDAITIADMAHTTITTSQSSTAARQNVYDSVATMLDKQNEVITADINDVSATDVAELAVRLMEAQTIYNMSLSVGARILPPSLADYLS